jgi:hypothetical protein
MLILSIDAQNLYMASKNWSQPLDYEAIFWYFKKYNLFLNLYVPAMQFCSKQLRQSA